MAEQVKSITDALQGLPGLSSSADERMERYIITQEGQPQSVLLGYKDYLGMLAAVELLHQPAALANLHRGLQQLQEGEGLTFDEMEAAIERAEANEPAQVILEPISQTIEIPEVGNVEVIFTRATIGGRNKMPEGNAVSDVLKTAE